MSARARLKVIDGGADTGSSPQPVAAPAEDRIPPPPAKLPAEMHDDWASIVAELQDRKTWTDGTAGVLESYLLARWSARRAQALIEKHGELIEASDGTLKSNPALGMLREGQNAVRRLAAELQLTPAARAKRGKPSQDEDFVGDLFADLGLRGSAR